VGGVQPRRCLTTKAIKATAVAPAKPANKAEAGADGAGKV
jgi:hypothetical protein